MNSDMSRVDQPRMMRFKNPFSGIGGRFIYIPDLLPGPNFNWLQRWIHPVCGFTIYKQPR